MSIARDTLAGANDVTGAANALTANANVVAANSVDRMNISAPQVFGLQCLEILERLRAGLMVELMSHPVAKRAAENEGGLQSEMQAHLRCEIDCALAHLRLIGFLGTGVSLTGHHAEFAETRHECLVGIAALFRRVVGQRGHNKCDRQAQAASMVRMGYASIIVSKVVSTGSQALRDACAPSNYQRPIDAAAAVPRKLHVADHNTFPMATSRAALGRARWAFAVQSASTCRRSCSLRSADLFRYGCRVDTSGGPFGAGGNACPVA